MTQTVNVFYFVPNSPCFHWHNSDFNITSLAYGPPMVILPRPIGFTGDSGVLNLPSTNLSLLVPPNSTTTNCCYQFGLTELPLKAQASIDNGLFDVLSRLFTLSQLLAVPTLFGRGDGQVWTHSEQQYPALLRWKEQRVPSLLAQLSESLQQLNKSNASSASGATSQTVHLVLGHVVCAVARYLPLSPTFIDPGSTAPPTAPHQDGWISEASSTQARVILSGLHSQHPPSTSAIAPALLSDYIKPIIREAASSSSASISSVNPQTGRKNPPAAGSQFISPLDTNLGQHRFQSAGEDGDASNLVPRKFGAQLSNEVLEKVGLEASFGTGEACDDRNEALGCVNVLAWCLDHLQLEVESDWVDAWPLVVPALLTLLEHPQPRFRLQGSWLVHRLLSRPSRSEHVTEDMVEADPSAVRRRENVVGKMLIRTGIGSLLERGLHVNLTYVHDAEYAPALLYHSIGSLRQLILLTTHRIAYRDPSEPLLAPPLIAPSEIKNTASIDDRNDCGRRRMEALFRLVSESILSTWSYLPLPPASTRLGRALVDVTCSAYMMLADDLCPPLPFKSLGGSARFLDVSIDWIFRSWLSHLTLDHMDQLSITIKVIRLASRLLFCNASEAEPEIGTSTRFLALILSSTAKCYISSLESRLRTRSHTATAASALLSQLDESLATFLETLSRSNASVASRWAQLVKLDQRLEALLPSSMSS